MVTAIRKHNSGRVRSGSRRRAPLRKQLYMEFLEERQLMDVGLARTADWYRNVACMEPPDFAMENEGPSLTGQDSMPTVHLTQGWATFGQVLPQGAAFDAVQVGNLVTQTDVKTRWEDGSIRFAVVTANAPLAGNYTLTASNPSTGWVVPDLPPVSVWFWMHGDWYYANAQDLDWTDPWLSGPLVTEARHTATVRHWGSDTPYPNLRVVFDVRAYADGQSRFDVAVENTLDQAGAGWESYEYWAFNGADAIYYKENIQQPYLTRWRQVLPIGLQESEVTPDFEPAYQANALPRYWQGVANWINGPNGTNFEPLGPGALNPDMGAHGGREEIAPYPDWAARYLVHKDPTQKSFVLAHGDLAGSWPIHVRNPDNSMIRLDQRPRFWMDIPTFRDPQEEKPAGNLGHLGQLMPDNAHQPSLAYIPYLVTGDRYFADEMAFWANYTMLASIPGIRGGNGSEGLLWSNETRGFAWGLRNLGDAAAYLPDDYPLKAYFNERVANNMNWLTQHAATNVGPLGVAFHRSPFDSGDNPYFDPDRTRIWQSVAQNNYLAWSVDHANKQGFGGGEEFKLQMARFNIALLTNPLTRDGAAPYYTPIGDRVPRGSETIDWYTNIEQTYQGPTEYAGYYGVDARLMCNLGIENGIAGAEEAYEYLRPLLMEQPIYEYIPDLGVRAGWSQMPPMAV